MIDPTGQRSRIMRAVKGRDTIPELLVRRAAHRMGYRFRLHRRDLPGSPDLVFPRLRKAIFIHGCFWHGHSCARGARIPKSNRDYWIKKISRNMLRDRGAKAKLKADGWDVLILWECRIKENVKLERALRLFLDGPAPD